MESIVDFEAYKYTIIKRVEKDINDILTLTDNYLNIYKKFKHESDPKKKVEYRQKSYEYMKLIHYSFSDLENILREYQEIAQAKNIKLKEENIPEFDDQVEMSREEYNKFKKENDPDEQRMIIWLKLFKKKIIYLTDIIKKDIKDNYQVTKKIKLINQFYRQIYVAYKVILNDAFMAGAAEKKIKIL